MRRRSKSQARVSACFDGVLEGLERAHFQIASCSSTRSAQTQFAMSAVKTNLPRMKRWLRQSLPTSPDHHCVVCREIPCQRSCFDVFCKSSLFLRCQRRLTTNFLPLGFTASLSRLDDLLPCRHPQLFRMLSVVSERKPPQKHGLKASSVDVVWWPNLPDSRNTSCSIGRSHVSKNCPSSCCSVCCC